MSDTRLTDTDELRPTDTDQLREVTETLSPLKRRAGSADERRAAEWLAERLRRAGADAQVEAVGFYDGYAGELLPLAGIGLACGAYALTVRRSLLAATLAGVASAAIADDVANGRRPWRRLLNRRKTTTNVVAAIGDPATAADTLVVLAHHDAAPTGHAFDPRLQQAVARLAPGLLQRINTSIPLFWPVIAAPAVVALGALTGRRAVTAAGMAATAVVGLVGVDIARSPVVPGANDNLSGVAALVGVAEALRVAPAPPGVAVLLVSLGAEEVLQGGVYPFVEKHLARLDRRRTWVLNLETVGSPHLVMLEGEGVTRMEDYTDPSWRDRVAATAAEAGVALIRGQRSRSSTDSVVTSRAGYPTATLTSFDPVTKLLTNYHLMSDLPEHLTYETIRSAVTVAVGLARGMGRG
ncbi:M28 family peptidase [Acidiferrimicrobium sp. IK]|uniref:M28 family peptidase n=1 Tax=Acidiferrimicrobium sp. IK TaxID=2871700 RepID=UPI0021CB0267|nr:M28 family peptidase [Acidiferrimicrobium sp. IK]MCU4182824.1 M28 family peptidase [Acidiferrimicrobium sp. IK]